MSKSNRRSFIDLAEAVRTLNVDSATKRIVASDLAISLRGQEDFHADRFQEHALSEVSAEEGGKWAYNRRTGEGEQGNGGFGFRDADEDEAEETEED